MNDIYAILDKLSISYTRHGHPAVFTCEEAEKYCGDIPGRADKNLFLRNRSGDRHYLVVMCADKKADLKKLALLLDESKLSFASPERLMKYLGLTPGSVSPFGLINDAQKEVRVIVDEEIMREERVHFHPNINTSTIDISTKDFREFLTWCGNPVQFISI